MANPGEHIALLQRAVAAPDISIWNGWLKEERKRETLFRPNLHRADLAGADLGGADLYHADLSEAILRGANLTKARLRWADLRDADLTGAICAEAQLTWATLHSANLRDANLNGVELNGANMTLADCAGANFQRARMVETVLRQTDLANADWTGARVGYTTFVDLDLSSVKGLEQVMHDGPSNLGIDTLYKSGGKIPEAFLRGCGVPESIMLLATTLSANDAYYSVFISYATADEAFARRLHTDLQANGVRVWFAPEDLKIGGRFRNDIDEAIRSYDKLIVVLSEHSIASDWVETEVETAFERERRSGQLVLFPIRLDNAVMETNDAWAANIRRVRHIGDFTKWENPLVYQGVMKRLLRDLNASAGDGGSAQVRG